jgi:hypothetical protein
MQGIEKIPFIHAKNEKKHPPNFGHKGNCNISGADWNVY